MSGLGVTRPRQIDCRACPLLQLEAFRKFTTEELAFVSSFKKGEMLVPAGATILSEGEETDHLFTILNGWGFRHKTIADGRRQILNFVMPGHLLGLQGSVLEVMQHSIEALTDMVLCVFRRDELWTLYEQFPSLAFDMTWLSAREEMLIDEHLLSVGRRQAVERTAFLLLHLYRRAEKVGLARDYRIRFPFTQQHLADALGLSLVHTNKTLRRLALSQMLRWNNGECQILNPPALADLARCDLDDDIIRPFI